MTAATDVIDITAAPRKSFPVRLVGVEYQVNPPKSALALKIAIRAKTIGDDPTLMLEVLDDWLVRAFGKETSDAIKARLDDEDDDLDFQHIMMLMKAIVEKQAEGNPTSS